MIGSASTSRRAHAFAQLLDDEEAAEGPVAGLVDAPTAAALSVARQLAALPRPALSAETRSAQRARLTAAAEAVHAPSSPASSSASTPTAALEAPPPLPEQRQRRRRPARGLHRAVPVAAFGRLRPRTRLSKGLAASGLTMGVAAGALGGVAAASTDALPGDTLYGLKRGMEDLRLDFAGNDVDRGGVYLDRAATRLNEARRLMERARAGGLDADDIDEVHRALSSMRDDAAEGHRLLSGAYESDGSLAALRALSAFTENHADTWGQLRPQLPAELHEISAEISGIFDAIQRDILPLQPLPSQEPEATATPDAPAGPGIAGTAPTTDPSASPTRSPATAPASTPAADPTGTPEGAGRGTGSASPHPTRQHDDGGLLEGTGLLPTSPIGETAPDTGTIAPSSSQQGGALPAPDVTIPPLVDDLLPKLGLDVPEGD
ncbi:DUF5667 domain-containing protein [Streptomyces sp. 6N223]|uniref:DUF5667 domain-containing protein n=1 Tax=Streptomyces sp. 6N223 TaxID=3457412 RepID=UPI003FD19508